MTKKPLGEVDFGVAMPEDEMREHLRDWLARHLHDPSLTILSVERPTSSGFSTETLLIEIQSGDRTRGVVLRFETPAEFSLFMCPSVDLQFKVISAVWRSGVIPIPAPVGMEPDPSVLGRPFMVLERVQGRAAPQVPNLNTAGWVAELEPEQREDLWRQAIGTMARLHCLDWRDGFGFLDRPDLGESALEQVLEATGRWYQWAKRRRPHPLIERALEQLNAERPRHSETSVLWGDASPTNMLFEGRSISAVLDWEVAALGPPELDLAWWLFFQDYLSRGFGNPLLPGIPGREETIRIYEAALGRAVRSIEYFDLLACTRNAIVSFRSVNRQVTLGRIPESTTAATNNPISRLLAEQLGVAPPDLGADYSAYLSAVLDAKRQL